MNDTLNTYRKELIELVNSASQENGLFTTRVPGLCTLRSDSKTCTNPGIYEPMLCLMLQGSKKLYVGEQELLYSEMNYLLVPVMIPVVGEIIQASETEPYMGISVSLDLKELSELLIDMAESTTEACTNGCSIKILDADIELMSVFKRLLQLHDSPQDIPIMLPMLKRELMYRILKGPAGAQLRKFMLYGSNANKISKVIEMIRENFDAPLKVKELANEVHMSESSLFSSFKSVTSMSPLQYQKHIRLNEARRIMLHEGLEASAAGFKVGYESPSQFSREYSRLFGAPPMADINRVRKAQAMPA